MVLPKGVSISLMVLDGPRQGERIVIESLPAYLGGAGDLEVVVPGPGVAPVHARLDWSGAGIFLEDMKTGGVTKVNGSQVQSLKLQNGDIVEIGESKLLLQLAIPMEKLLFGGSEHEVSRTESPSGQAVWIAGFSEEMRGWLNQKLRSEVGRELQVFRTGEEVLIALSQALIQNRPPSLLILDLRLAIINGVNVAIAARAFELGFRSQAHIQIIFLFHPPESVNFDKVIKFCQPLQVVTPGEDEEGTKRIIQKIADPRYQFAPPSDLSA